ncbi:hypothetical protein [Solilutibacter oculi]|nr:hypothetical protein [Lysobacter oculi]
MKFRTMIWLAGAAAALMVAGTAVAQQKDAARADATEQSHKDGSADRAKAEADARKRADTEAAKQRRAERKASRTGDDREEEEEKPVR